MAVAKITELRAESEKGFEDAVEQGIQRASDTLDNVKSAWIKDHRVTVEDGEISMYRVDLEVTFVLKD